MTVVLYLVQYVLPIPPSSWAQEFVSTPNHGHVALIDLIKDLADYPYSVPRKNPRKYTMLERDPVS